MIQPLKSSPLRGLVIPHNNRDKALLVAIMQVRRYMYGGLSNRDITDYISGRKRHLHFKGVMSFILCLTMKFNLKSWMGGLSQRSIDVFSYDLSY